MNFPIAHNIVTAASSLLIWMVNVATMIPGSILMIKSGPNLDASHIITLVNFQIATVLAFSIVNPLLYVCSSADLRKDIEVCKRHLMRRIPEPNITRGEIYSIPMENR